MEIVQFIGGAAIIICLLSIIVGWIIYLIQWIFCRKKVSCDKKCPFKLHCISHSVSKKEELHLRQLMIEKHIKDKENEGQ